LKEIWDTTPDHEIRWQKLKDVKAVTTQGTKVLLIILKGNGKVMTIGPCMYALPAVHKNDPEFSTRGLCWDDFIRHYKEHHDNIDMELAHLPVGKYRVKVFYKNTSDEEFSAGDKVSVKPSARKKSKPGIVKERTAQGYTVARLSGPQKGELWMSKKDGKPRQFSREMLSPLHNPQNLHISDNNYVTFKPRRRERAREPRWRERVHSIWYP